MTDEVCPICEGRRWINVVREKNGTYTATACQCALGEPSPERDAELLTSQGLELHWPVGVREPPE